MSMIVSCLRNARDLRDSTCLPHSLRACGMRTERNCVVTVILAAAKLARISYYDRESIADALLPGARRPALIVPRIGVLTMTNQVTRIVVGTDFSDTALVALEQAFELAAREALAEVHVVNAVQHLGEFVQMDMLPDASMYQLPLAEAQERLDAYVGARLSDWQARTQRTLSRCSTYLSTDFPVEAIVQLATDLEAQLVVVGTHGRRGVRRFFLGSVAEGVVRLAHTPVLVVRPQDETAKVPAIEPPCPRCLAARKASAGQDLWCEQHSEKHGRRHVYHFDSRLNREGNVGPL